MGEVSNQGNTHGLNVRAMVARLEQTATPAKTTPTDAKTTEAEQGVLAPEAKHVSSPTTIVKRESQTSLKQSTSGTEELKTSLSNVADVGVKSAKSGRPLPPTPTKPAILATENLPPDKKLPALPILKIKTQEEALAKLGSTNKESLATLRSVEKELSIGNTSYSSAQVKKSQKHLESASKNLVAYKPEYRAAYRELKSLKETTNKSEEAILKYKEAEGKFNLCKDKLNNLNNELIKSEEKHLNITLSNIKSAKTNLIKAHTQLKSLKKENPEGGLKDYVNKKITVPRLEKKIVKLNEEMAKAKEIGLLPFNDGLNNANKNLKEARISLKKLEDIPAKDKNVKIKNEIELMKTEIINLELEVQTSENKLNDIKMEILGLQSFKPKDLFGVNPKTESLFGVSLPSNRMTLDELKNKDKINDHEFNLAVKLIFSNVNGKGVDLAGVNDFIVRTIFTVVSGNSDNVDYSKLNQEDPKYNSQYVHYDITKQDRDNIDFNIIQQDVEKNVFKHAQQKISITKEEFNALITDQKGITDKKVLDIDRAPEKEDLLTKLKNNTWGDKEEITLTQFVNSEDNVEDLKNELNEIINANQLNTDLLNIKSKQLENEPDNSLLRDEIDKLKANRKEAMAKQIVLNPKIKKAEVLENIPKCIENLCNDKDFQEITKKFLLS